MATKFFVELEGNDDPTGQVLLGLDQLTDGVKIHQAFMVQIENRLVCDAVLRLLDATDRAYQVVVDEESMDSPLQAGEETQPANEAELDPVDKTASETLTLNGQDLVPPPSEPGKECAECGRRFTPKSNRQKYCDRADCRAARARRWVKESTSRRRAAKEPSEAELEKIEMEEVADFEKVLEAEATDEQNPLKHSEESLPDGEDETPKKALTGEEGISPLEPAVWYVENGSRAGTWMSSHSLSVALQMGDLEVGQLLQHNSRGMHKVIEIPGKKAQKLCQIQTGVPQAIRIRK